jgi:hypothetical protein
VASSIIVSDRHSTVSFNRSNFHVGVSPDLDGIAILRAPPASPALSRITYWVNINENGHHQSARSHPD